MLSRTVRATALATLLVLAGCGGGTVTDVNTVNPGLDDTPSATPTATPTPDYPPGVGPNDTDVDSLRVAHDRAFDSRNASYRTVQTIRGTNGILLYRQSEIVRTEGDTFVSRSRITEENSSLGIDGRNESIWTNGTVEARRSELADGNLSLYTVEMENLLTEQPTGRWVVFSTLLGLSLDPTGVNETANGTVVTLRGSASSISAFRGAERQNVSAVARVRDDGLVLSLAVQYEQQFEDQSVIVDIQFRVTRTAGTNVSRPAWVSAAVQNSTGS